MLNPKNTTIHLVENSELPYFDALFPSGNRGAVGTYNFATPGRVGAGTQDPKFSASNIVLDGYFRVRNNIGNPSPSTGQIYDNATIGVSENGLIIVGQRLDTVNFMEVGVPQNLSPSAGSLSNQYSGLVEASSIQNFYTVNESLLQNQFSPTSDRKPGFIYVRNNKIYLSYYTFYGYSVTNILIGDNASDFPSCNWQGWMTADGTDRAAMYMNEIPVEHRGMFNGHTHLCGANFTMAIMGRGSFGPSFYAFSPDSIQPSDTHITRDRYMRFSQDRKADYVDVDAAVALNHYADQIGMPVDRYVLIPNKHRVSSLSAFPSYDNALCPDSGGYENRSGVGFIMPGTSTFVSVGSMMGVRNGVLYKRPSIENSEKSPGGGFTPTSETDRDNMIWAYHLNDISVSGANTETNDLVPLQASAQISCEIPADRGAYDEANQKLYLCSTTTDGGGRQLIVAVYSVITAQD
jgi:hypothetical protein